MSAPAPDSQESLVPQSPPPLPITPTPAHARLPDDKSQSLTTGHAPQSLTPPPSSQHRIKFASPPPHAPPALSSPPGTVSRYHDKVLGDTSDLGAMHERTATMTTTELRETVERLATALNDAKTTAAHYKLQHQMSQMESGEAVERMAVEMEMARREIEVLQQAEAHRRLQEHSRDAPPAEHPNFRQVHNDIYDAMMDELRELKTQNAHLEHDLNHSRRVVALQEGEIASLNDKVSLMRDRIRESRDQLLRGRRQGTAEATPRSNRIISPYQTPVRERFTAGETPRGYRYEQRPPPAQPQFQAQQSQQQQPGFAALLQATDIVSSQGSARGHSRNSQSMSSLPTTPSRQTRVPVHMLYTPQPARHAPMEAPHTAPVARKRGRDAVTPPPMPTRTYESDGTVSAVDEDSEAETEVAEGQSDAEQRPAERQTYREGSQGRVIKRAKSAHNVKAMTQRTLFGPVRKYGVERGEGEKPQ